MIREMRKSDWNEMMKIYSQSLEKGTVTFRTECPTFDEWDSEHIKECRYVYETDGKIVGYTMIAPTSRRDSYRGVVELSIFVDEAYLHKGIGTILMKKLMTESEKRGYWMLYSAIFSNNIASVELHKKCGFRVIGIREDIARDRFGEWQSTTIMEWRNKIR